MMTPHKILGLAVSEQSISAVEVGGGHGRRKVLRAAELSVPEGVAATEPAALGRALRQFLRREHFSASHAVIGLGARWLVAKDKTLPPTAPDLLRGVLTIAAEREFASDAEDLAVDYCDLPAAGEGQRVLLVAASRRNVSHLAAAADAAGLKVEAVTSSTMALAAATGRQAASRRVVLNLVAVRGRVVPPGGRRHPAPQAVLPAALWRGPARSLDRRLGGRVAPRDRPPAG